MYGRGNFIPQVGQGPALQAAFQQNPVGAPPPPPNHVPLAPQPQVSQQGHPSFHFRPGIFTYQHNLPSVPLRGPPVPVVSSELSSTHSHATHPQPLQVNWNPQITHSNQYMPWSQNSHQFSSAIRLPDQSAYPLASCGSGQPYQPPSLAPSPQLHPNTSSTNFSKANQFGDPVLSQNSHVGSVGPLPPPSPPPSLPPPPPPPRLPYSPLEVQPLSPSSPSLDISASKDGDCNFKRDLLNGNNKSNQFFASSPQLHPNTSSTNFSKANQFGDPVLSQNSHLGPVGPLPPPLPPPSLPPPPPSPRLPISPLEVQPLSPSSPSLDISASKDGDCNFKRDLLNGNNLNKEHVSSQHGVDDRSVHQIEILSEHTEKIEVKTELVDAVDTRSPADSDIDMEDDITHSDEKNIPITNNSNDDISTSSRDDCVKEQLQDMRDNYKCILPEVAVPAVSKGLSGDDITLPGEENNPIINNSNDDISTSRDDCVKEQLQDMRDTYKCVLPEVAVLAVSKDLTGGMTRVGQAEQPLSLSSLERGNLEKPCVSVACAETGHGKLSGKDIKGVESFNLLQDYSSENSSGSEGGVVSSPTEGGSTCFSTKKGCFGLELSPKSQSESVKHMPSKSIIESPDAKGGDKVEEFSDESHGQEYVKPQSREIKINHDADISFKNASLPQPETRSNATKLNVDEFGRLVREGVSDSDASDSSYASRHAKRDRKRRSRSRSRSPHDRRRKRSPWRRKVKRDRSRSLSLERRRSRNRSPVARRNIKSTRDNVRQEKSQSLECFDFIKGKCYRGASCRYSHGESYKSERKRYNRDKKQYHNKLPTLWSSDFPDERNVQLDREVKLKEPRRSSDMADPKEVEDSKEQPVDYTIHTFDEDAKNASLLVSDGIASDLPSYSDDLTSVKENYMIPKSPAQNSEKVQQILDQQGIRINDSSISESSMREAVTASSTHLSSGKSDVKQDPTSQMFPPLGILSVATSFGTGEVACQSMQDVHPSIASHQSQLNLPLPSFSQVMNVPFTQPLMQDYHFKPPAQFHPTPENYLPYQVPVSVQHSHFPGPSTSLSSLFFPPPPPTRPHFHLSNDIKTVEHSIPTVPSQHMQQSYTSKGSHPIEFPSRSTDQYQSYPIAWEPDQRPRVTNNFESGLTDRQGGSHISGEDPLARHLVGSKGPVQPLFQQASYGQQFSVAAGVSAQLTDTVEASSSISNVTTPDFLGRSRPVSHNFMGSGISDHFNPYASTFNLSLSSKLTSNALSRDNVFTTSSRYSSPFDLSSVPVDRHTILNVDSKNMISLLGSGLPAESVIPRPAGQQYDPLLHSIEPTSNSFIGADHRKHETIGDSDDVAGFNESGRILDVEGIKREGGAAVSSNDSLDNEEYGETADAEVGAVSNGSPSDPNDATRVNPGEIEIDQVKKSEKKKKGKERSMKLFKNSIAAFVKEVLKPSWRQGNMSKEAFKTIVKKTVDKVSGAMKSRRIPKSQTSTNQYIDSSRGKLTKLVMGYVNKYVKA